MTNHTYGIDSNRNGYIDTSKTLLGAKQHATRNGYTKIYIRFNGGYITALIAEKINGRWVNLNNI